MVAKNKQDKKIELLASSIVNTMFKDFQNPKFQGEAFTWEKFPEMMRSLAQGYTPATFYNLSGEKLEKVEEIVGELAFNLAKERVDTEIFKKTSPKP